MEKSRQKTIKGQKRMGSLLQKPQSDNSDLICGFLAAEELGQEGRPPSRDPHSQQP